MHLCKALGLCADAAAAKRAHIKGRHDYGAAPELPGRKHRTDTIETAAVRPAPCQPFIDWKDGAPTRSLPCLRRSRTGGGTRPSGGPGPPTPEPDPPHPGVDLIPKVQQPWAQRDCPNAPLRRFQGRNVCGRKV